jgi:hypothetical protein
MLHQWQHQQLHAIDVSAKPVMHHRHLHFPGKEQVRHAQGVLHGQQQLRERG